MIKKMNNVYLIFGYGVPDNILKDENMRTYQRIVFNTIFDRENGTAPLIIFCGGHTDIKKPYRRSEAQELLKLFKTFAQRIFVKKQTRLWKYATETKSLSAVENMLEAQKIIKARRITYPRITLFCEYTRKARNQKLVQAVFKKKLEICAIDFDTSPNRYLDPKYLKKKEAMELHAGLWALQSPSNLNKYRRLCERRIAYFQSMGRERHVEAIQTWWKEKLKELKV